MLAQLSSQRKDRSEYSNRKAAIQCLEDPELLEQIAQGLSGLSAALAGDCAEVMTMVAQDQPELVVPYANQLAALVTHPAARVRWEAVHALALVAALAPDLVERLIPTLAEGIRSDASVIVRDYAVEMLGAYAGTGQAAAERALPLLKEALTVWDGKHAGRALVGLANAAAWLPALQAELGQIAGEYAHSRRGVVRQAARRLSKALGNQPPL